MNYRYQLRIAQHLVEESADKEMIQRMAGREASAGTEFVSVWKVDADGYTVGKLHYLTKREVA